MQSRKLTATYLKVKEGYIGFIQEIPGANTQGKTLKEVKENLLEALDLVLTSNRLLSRQSVRGRKARIEKILI